MTGRFWRVATAFAGAVVILLAIGCAGGLVSRDIEATASLDGYSLNTDPDAGTVDGYVYVPLAAQRRQGGGLTEGDSSTPPTGYGPANGAQCVLGTQTVFADGYGYYIFRNLTGDTVEVQISYGGDTISNQKTVVLHGSGTYKYYVNMAQVSSDWAEYRNRLKNINRVNLGYSYHNSTPGEQTVTLRLYVSDNGSLTSADIAGSSDAVLIHEGALPSGSGQVGLETDNVDNDSAFIQQLLSDRFFIYAVASPAEADVTVSSFVFDMEIRVGI